METPAWEAWPVAAVDGQHAAAGTRLADSVAVFVIDAAGAPLVGATVRWSTDAGNGRIDPATSRTGSDGIARAAWSLDTVAGRQIAHAEIAGLAAPIRLTARALPGAVTSLRIRRPSDDALAVGRTLGLTTDRSDRYGNAVADGHPEWRSLTPAIASVNTLGVVTGLATGSATILASEGAAADTVTIPVTAGGAGGWIALDAGGGGVGGHACGVRDTGRAYCWGYNDGGQLGTGTIVPRTAPEPVAQPEGIAFVAIRTGVGASKLSCALTGDGRLFCWGESALGNGSAASKVPVPVDLPPGERFASFDIGRDHVCVASETGTVYCWGANEAGQTGTGSAGTVGTPAPVSLPEQVRSVSSGAESTCALTVSAAVYCWGRNDAGQLGAGDTDPSPAPRHVALEPAFAPVALASGVDHHCVLGAAGAVRCWGRNSAGQIGIGSAGAPVLAPAPVVLPEGLVFETASGGLGHTCAAARNGDIYCWGANDSGQLGIGSTANALQPSRVLTPLGVTFIHVALAGASSCALTAAGEAYCWGSDTQGQLGNGALPPSTVPGLVNTP